MMENPLASIVILNRDRKEKAIRCVESVLAQDYPHTEILLVDNASQDGSVVAIRERFGDRVRVIERKINSVTEGRNDGFRLARGEFVLSLDNDMILSDPAFLRKGLAWFQRYPRTAVLTPIIGSPEDPDRFQKEHWWHPFEMESHHDRPFFTPYFPEAAVYFRAEALNEVGGYDEEFFMGFEQADLAIRLIRRGWRILYCPELACIEEDDRPEFVSRRHTIHYYNLRNKLWTAWKHYPAFQAAGFAASRIAVALIRSCRYGYPDLIFRAAFRGLFAPASIRHQRCPMTRDEWREWVSQQKGEVIATP